MRAFDAAWSVLKAFEGDRMVRPLGRYYSGQKTAHPAITGMLARRNAERPVNPVTAQLANNAYDTQHSEGGATRTRQIDPYNWTHEMHGGRLTSFRPPNKYEFGTPHHALQDAMMMNTVPISTGRGVMEPPYLDFRNLHPEEVANPGYAAEDVPVSMRGNIGQDGLSAYFRDLVAGKIPSQ